MPRVTQAWKNNPQRNRYYKLRADKLEMENRLAREGDVEAKTIKKDLASFCGAIRARIDASELEPNLKSELSEDITDWLTKVPLNGQSNGKSRSTRRGRK
jgi:hypothetical protein